MAESLDKPEVVEEIISEQINLNNNTEHRAGPNTSLITNIQEIKGERYPEREMVNIYF